MTTSTERIDPSRTALIAYDVCKRILTPADPAARERMRPALESWAVLINACRELSIPIIYTTPVSRADGVDVVLLPTDLICYVCGSLRINYKKFLIGVLIGEGTVYAIYIFLGGSFVGR